MTASYRLSFDGRAHEIRVAGSELDRVHDPLLREVAARAAMQKGRFMVALAGPPGAGKSTLAALWVARAAELALAPAFQSLSMDGFHLPNRVLEARTVTAPDGSPIPLRRLKGVPETYDLAVLRAAFERLHSGDALRWPIYDRGIHDPVPAALAVIPSGVVLVEGNFLLLDEPGFRELRGLVDYAVFVECAEELTRGALKGRFAKAGRDSVDGERHIEEVDAPNWRRVMAARLPADATLHVGLGRAIEKKRGL